MDTTLIPKISYGEKLLAHNNIYDKIFLLLALNNFSVLVLKDRTIKKSIMYTTLSFGLGYWIMNISGLLRDKQLIYFDKSSNDNLKSATYYYKLVK